MPSEEVKRGTKLIDTGGVVQPSMKLDGATDSARAQFEAIVNGLSTDLPVMMLPVKLETKYLDATDGGAGKDLWIRIYPDDIFIQNHEHLLTQEEVDRGEEYWTEHYAGVGLRSAELTAWSKLCDRFGPQRALYIRKVMTPTSGTGSLSDFAQARTAIETARELLIDSEAHYSNSGAVTRLLSDIGLEMSSAIKALEKGGYVIQHDIDELRNLVLDFETLLNWEHDNTLNPFKRTLANAKIKSGVRSIERAVYTEDQDKIYYTDSALAKGATPYTKDSRGDHQALADGNYSLQSKGVISIKKGVVGQRNDTLAKENRHYTIIESDSGIDLAFEGEFPSNGLDIYRFELEPRGADEPYLLYEIRDSIYILQDGTSLSVRENKINHIDTSASDPERNNSGLQSTFSGLQSQIAEVMEELQTFGPEERPSPTPPALTFPRPTTKEDEWTV